MRALITFHGDTIQSINVVNPDDAREAYDKLRAAADNSEFDGFHIAEYAIDPIQTTLDYCFGENGQ